MRENRNGRVCAHGAEGFATGAGHRSDEDPQLFLGVAKGLLAAQDGGMSVGDVLALGKVFKVDQACVEPLRVRRLAGELGLDVVVLDDAALDRVDQEHPTGLEPTLADHSCRRNVEHADLGGEYDKSVVGNPESARAETVAVEHRSNQRAVGETDRCRAVPGLHKRRMKLVERPPCGVHGSVVLPRLRDHHEDRVRQAAATQMQQLQHLVEGCRVAGTRRADGEQPLQVAGDQITSEKGLAGPHPVAVAFDGVDLAVVRDVAIRVGQRPRGKGVGGEP